MDEKYVKCSECKISRNIEEAPECPICLMRKPVKKVTKKKVKFIRREILKGDPEDLERMRNKCASCLSEFENSESHFRTNGNFCNRCISKIKKKEDWRKVYKGKCLLEAAIKALKREGKSIKVKVEKLEKQKAKLKDMTGYILSKWKIDMYKDHKEFRGLQKFFYGDLEEIKDEQIRQDVQEIEEEELNKYA